MKTLLELLTPVERKRAGLLLLMILVMALLDMIGVASIMPFMAVLANPEAEGPNPLLNRALAAAQKRGIESTERFQLLLGMLSFALMVASLAFKALTTYAQSRFALMREYSIGKRLTEGYLHQPYSWYLRRHSADLGKTILSEVREVIDKGVVPMMTLIAQGSVAAGLLTLLLLINPRLAIIVGLTLATAYGLIYRVTSGMLVRMGTERVQANQARFLALDEAFGAAKEVKIGGLEQAYIQRFAGPAQKYARHQATAQVIGQLPRFAVEAVAFGGMLLVMLYLMLRSGSSASALPIIALYGLAGYRLMPALQQTYVAVTQLRFAGPAVGALHADLMSLQPAPLSSNQGALPLKQAITLNNIQYRYPNAPRVALKNLTLTIPAKSTVGLVGATGSGKTTTVDLILGLLEAQQGTLKVDGTAINERNRRAWQRNIGYVPQQIYLADDTVAANIAFGLEARAIDHAAVQRAAKIANLHAFVTQELPLQYNTTVGERGVRLSGGQRQRIGIARALYHNPQVLIFDEATSALDTLTEQAVMEAVHNLRDEATIILIAHRLSTVRGCDIIFLLDSGELKAQGTFDTLNETNEIFREMAVTN